MNVPVLYAYDEVRYKGRRRTRVAMVLV